MGKPKIKIKNMAENFTTKTIMVCDTERERARIENFWGK